MHTIGLSNNIAFTQMADPGKQFPAIRVFGTLGWIAAGFVIGQTGWEKTPNTFILAAAVSAIYGLYSFTLPPTPPKAKTAESPSFGKSIGAEAIVLFKNKSYLIF